MSVNCEGVDDPPDARTGTATLRRRGMFMGDGALPTTPWITSLSVDSEGRTKEVDQTWRTATASTADESFQLRTVSQGSNVRPAVEESERNRYVRMLTGMSPSDEEVRFVNTCLPEECARDGPRVKGYDDDALHVQWKRVNDGTHAERIGECEKTKTRKQCMAEHQTVEAASLEERLVENATAYRSLEAKETSVDSADIDRTVDPSDVRFLTHPGLFADDASVQVDEDSSGSVSTGARPLEKCLLRMFVCQHIDVSVAVERFVGDGEFVVDFYNREAQEARRFMDDYLPEYPVHVLTAGEIFRLRISVHGDDRTPFPLEGVTSVDAEPPDGEAKALRIWQDIDGRRLTALALVDPKEFESRRMKTSCPIFGLVETKYVQLVVRVKLRLGGGYPEELQLFHPVYLQLKRPPRIRQLFKDLIKRMRNLVRI